MEGVWDWTKNPGLKCGADSWLWNWPSLPSGRFILVEFPPQPAKSANWGGGGGHDTQFSFHSWQKWSLGLTMWFELPPTSLQRQRHWSNHVTRDNIQIQSKETASSTTAVNMKQKVQKAHIYNFIVQKSLSKDMRNTAIPKWFPYPLEAVEECLFISLW